MADVQVIRVVIGLTVAIGLILFLVTRTKVHVFPSMIIGALAAGLVSGLPSAQVLSAIQSGFGGTLGSIGIIIGFGVMMGAIFEVSGAAKRMAITFIKLLGKGKEDVAMMITGFIVSIPVFCDSAFVVLSPLAKSLSRNTGRSLITISCALGTALLVTHSLIPPTPGPLAITTYFQLDIGIFMIYSLIAAVPITIAGLLYARWIGKRLFRLPSVEDSSVLIDRPYTTEELTEEVSYSTDGIPGTFLSFAPILIPIVLILLNTVGNMTGFSGILKSITGTVGHPVVAVGIGLLIAIYGLAGKMDRKEVIGILDDSIKHAGIIVFVTGAGGALGAVLKASGAGEQIAQALVNAHIPGIVLPYLMAFLLRIVTGSATVGMLTAGSISAPILLTMTGVNPYMAGLACCIGSIGITNLHNSYFWVVNRTTGLTDIKDMLWNWFGAVLSLSVVGAVVLFVMNAIV
ncbi:MAG: GntP family permease [Spirochaetia bacterium]|nr:GntP family permease [Spirochaetia bacterium]MCF7941213.1 GntP family permease [Spirochaetia bacterium]